MSRVPLGILLYVAAVFALFARIGFSGIPIDWLVIGTAALLIVIVASAVVIGFQVDNLSEKSMKWLARILGRILTPIALVVVIGSFFCTWPFGHSTVIYSTHEIQVAKGMTWINPFEDDVKKCALEQSVACEGIIVWYRYDGTMLQFLRQYGPDDSVVFAGIDDRISGAVQYTLDRYQRVRWYEQLVRLSEVLDTLSLPEHFRINHDFKLSSLTESL